MQKFIILTVCILLTAVGSFSQARKTPVKSTPKKPVSIPTPTVSEIPVTEWNEITKSLEAENWDKSFLLASIALKKLKTDNEKKQLASLRYFYLYSLAGKVEQKRTTYAEFQKISQAFVGKEFLMPSRQVLADCTGKVNYICAVKNKEKNLRVTATNKSASAIHFFEYVELNETFDFSGNNERNVFLGGKLKKIESEVKNNIRIIRLFFENGSAEIVAKI